MKILIIGDSFAADWTVKYPDGKGWVNLLAEHYQVTNLAQAGIGEYKIYQQLKSIDDIKEYDIVIVSHTSPYRVHTRKHPVHYNDLLHKNADLSISDIQYHARSLKFYFNSSLRSAYRFFKDHFDSDYNKEIYYLVRDAIHKKLQGVRFIVVNNFICPDHLDDLLVETVNLSLIQKENPGLHNHLSDDGNQKVFDILRQAINGSE